MYQDVQDQEAKKQSSIGSDVLMTPAQKRFYASQQCVVAQEALQRLVDNPAYNTSSTYFTSSSLGFVDRHLHYLSIHPLINVAGYISNLKLMTGSKRS